MTLEDFNHLSNEQAFQELQKCCVSSNWIKEMIDHRPFVSVTDIVEIASAIWYSSCSNEDYLEAFTGHPKIGDIHSLKQKFSNTKDWAEKEQAAINEANNDTIEQLALFNDQYLKKFGFIFIVSASGKSAAEILHLIKIRVNQEFTTELGIAMGEQHKITILRLMNLIPEIKEKEDLSSHITTHVLDTTSGIPGKSILIKLKLNNGNTWQTIALGVTNKDGRISDLLPPGRRLVAANYIMEFDIDNYFTLTDQIGFYPSVAIQFKVVDKNHYHIPLLLNPYGYTTYKGS